MYLLFQKGGLSQFTHLMVNDKDRTRRGNYTDHPQKHIHRINRTKVDRSKERGILCCSIYTAVLKSNICELFLRKKKSSPMKILTSVILNSWKSQINLVNNNKKHILRYTALLLH